MAELTSKRPVEREKSGDYLHTRAQLPEAPEQAPLLRRFSVIFAGIFFAICLTALAFTARDGWGTHRDFVTALPVPLWSLGGVALALLVVRMKWSGVFLGVAFLVAAALLTGYMFLNNEVIGGHETARRINASLAGLALLVGVHLLIFKAIQGEVKDPQRPPAAE
jgi:hypothetical protein